MVQGQFTGYGGGFNCPIITPGIQNGQWNLAYWVVPVPLPFGETIIQATDREISHSQSAHERRVRGDPPEHGAACCSPTTRPIRCIPNSFLRRLRQRHELPDLRRHQPQRAGQLGLQGPVHQPEFRHLHVRVAAGFTRASDGDAAGVRHRQRGRRGADVRGDEPRRLTPRSTTPSSRSSSTTRRPGSQYTMDTAVRSSFPNLNVSGIPIFADTSVPKGNVFGVNVKYTSMYMSEDAAFDFSGLLLAGAARADRPAGRRGLSATTF